MENAMIVSASEKEAQNKKALWLAGFVASYLVLYNVFDFIWKECLTSKGYSFDFLKLPGHIFSAVLIGMLIQRFSKNRKKKNEAQD